MRDEAEVGRAGCLMDWVVVQVEEGGTGGGCWAR